MIKRKPLRRKHGKPFAAAEIGKPTRNPILYCSWWFSLEIIESLTSRLVQTTKYRSELGLGPGIDIHSAYCVEQGYICNIIDTGCFVRFIGRLTGFSPKSKATDDRRSDLSQVFYWMKLVFRLKGQFLNLSSLPVAIGLYGYCYSGHAVFPNIYTSMEKPSQYPAVLLTSFAICTVMYVVVAVLGYMMFGESTASQFTLNMPQELVLSKIDVWATVKNELDIVAQILMTERFIVHVEDE
ncbi:Transmembrane amino acid transporter family protein [Perilla frutescens var. frutescens]|nr:Transmembrane amino acid transporter family protein [Perilla frutescens var. frutescens]